jgi:hypothetical protein
MHFVRNWPEALFILLVMFVPLGIAFANGSRFLLVFALSMVCGLALWVATIWIVGAIGGPRQ